MSKRYVHTCVRVRDPDASQRFYMGLPGDGDVLELTVNQGQTEPYDLGTGYNHMATATTCRASPSWPTPTATASS